MGRLSWGPGSVRDQCRPPVAPTPSVGPPVDPGPATHLRSPRDAGELVLWRAAAQIRTSATDRPDPGGDCRIMWLGLFPKGCDPPSSSLFSLNSVASLRTAEASRRASSCFSTDPGGVQCRSQV